MTNLEKTKYKKFKFRKIDDNFGISNEIKIIFVQIKARIIKFGLNNMI